MKREEIIRMAREVSNTPIDHHTTPDLFGVSQIERFAALVAAAERERFALECIDLVAFYGGPVDLEAAIRERGEQV